MVNSELQFTKAIRGLLAFSMIEVREDVSAYSMHPVVHEWALQVLGRERRAELVWLAMIIVSEAIPPSTQREYWVMQQRLAPHADCYYRWIGRNVAEAYYLEENGLKLDGNEEEMLGTILALGNLYKDQGRLDAAEEMCLRVLKRSEKALGERHPTTLTSVCNLASIMQSQSKYKAAEVMNQRALEGREKALGKDHIDTLTWLSKDNSRYTKIRHTLIESCRIQAK
jgi:hypothetical protein